MVITATLAAPAPWFLIGLVERAENESALRERDEKGGEASAYLADRTSSAIFNERSFRLQLLSEFRGADDQSLCIRAWLNESHLNVRQCQH